MSVKISCLSGFFRTSESVAAALSLLLNFSLALLIRYRTTRELRTYSRVLLCNCVVDSLFATASYLIEMHVDIRHGMLVIVTNGVFVGDIYTNLQLFGVYCFFAYFTIAMVSVPMLCRYLAVCRNHVMTASQLAMAIATAMLLAGSIPLVHNLIWVRDSLETVQEYAAMIADAPCSDAGEMYILPIMDKLWDGAFVLCTGGAVISITYACITFCNYNVKRVIKQSSHWSKSARAVQSQLNAAILFQAMTPLAVVVVPVFGAIAVITTGSEQVRVLSQFATTSLAWIPVMNPISTIISIKAYRRAVLNLLPRRVAIVSDCEQPPQVETMANNSTLFDGPTIT